MMNRTASTPGEWRRAIQSSYVPGLERGWRGLWRHFLAVVRRQEPVLVPHAVTLSAWVKGDTPTRFDVELPQEVMGGRVRAGRRIVCSALRNPGGELVIGPRHFDQVMRAQIKDRKDAWRHAEQGFIDQHGQFLTRSEAWAVALASGQLLRRVGSDRPELDSSNLY